MLRSSNAGGEPAINMPGLLLAFIVLLLAIHGVREFMSPMSDGKLVLDYGFVPARLSVAAGCASAADVVNDAVEGADGESADVNQALARYVSADTASALPSLLTYSLLHGSWTHAILNCVWLAAFGTPVVRRAGAWRSLALAVATSIGGALAYWIAGPLDPAPMIGASGLVSGFMGAAAIFVFASPDPAPGSRFGAASRGAGGGPVTGLLRNRSALFFLGSWLVLNVLTGLLAGPLGIVSGGIAWQAHIGGLVTGLLLFPLIDPAGNPKVARLDP